MLNPYIQGTFRLYWQLQGAGCNGVVEGKSRVVSVDDYERPTGQWQEVLIPLEAFGG